MLNKLIELANEIFGGDTSTVADVPTVEVEVKADIGNGLEVVDGFDFPSSEALKQIGIPELLQLYVAYADQFALKDGSDIVSRLIFNSARQLKTDVSNEKRRQATEEDDFVARTLRSLDKKVAKGNKAARVQADALREAYGIPGDSVRRVKS